MLKEVSIVDTHLPRQATIRSYEPNFWGTLKYGNWGQKALFGVANDAYLSFRTLFPFGDKEYGLDGSEYSTRERTLAFGQTATLFIPFGSGTAATKTITNAGETFGEFGIPKLYTYTTGGESIFVAPNALKHLGELEANGIKTLGADYVKLLGQTYQKSLHHAIDEVLSRGSIMYDHLYFSGGNEIMFGAPRSAGELPAVIHFR